jgi:hypothetical protein
MRSWRVDKLENFAPGIGRRYRGKVYSKSLYPFYRDFWKVEHGHIVEFLIYRDEDKKVVNGIIYKVNNFGDRYYRVDINENKE